MAESLSSRLAILKKLRHVSYHASVTMGLFDFLKKKPAPFPEQAVIVHLPGSGLPDEVYEQYDLSTLEDQLRAVIEKRKIGEFDGNEFGPNETVLYMYGPDAERLFREIEPVLRAYPLCKNGSASIRCGPPGTPQREVPLS